MPINFGIDYIAVYSTMALAAAMVLMWERWWRRKIYWIVSSLVMITNISLMISVVPPTRDLIDYLILLPLAFIYGIAAGYVIRMYIEFLHSLRH